MKNRSRRITDGEKRSDMRRKAGKRKDKNEEKEKERERKRE